MPIVGHKMDTILSGRQMFAKYKHFETICEQTCANSPVFSILLSLFGDRPSKDWTPYEKLLRLFVYQFAILFHAFPSMSFHVVGPSRNF